jgi:hypothetical protein
MAVFSTLDVQKFIAFFLEHIEKKHINRIY